jgi:Na+/H+ antiporter NhaD/arsenite permease-like protein
LGFILAGAMWLGGQRDLWWVVAIFVVYAAFLFVMSPRSEVIALMSGEARDERQRSINEKATAATGGVLILVLVGGFLVATVLGSDTAMVFANSRRSPA